MLLTSNSSDASKKPNLLQASNLAAKSKESQVSNTPMSNVNITSTKEATMKEVNPSDSSFMESLNEDTNIDDLGQRSINNDALSKDLDQIEPENDVRLHEEECILGMILKIVQKEHMWQPVLNKFDGKGYPLDRKTSIEHMKRLWQNWRGILHQNSIIKKGGPENALKETPNDLTREDWNWLVKEHFMNEDFKKVSSRLATEKI